MKTFPHPQTASQNRASLGDAYNESDAGGEEGKMNKFLKLFAHKNAGQIFESLICYLPVKHLFSFCKSDFTGLYFYVPGGRS